MTAHHPYCVRLLFIVLIPCLFLQLKVRQITEPYPAILLPAGGGLIESRGSFTMVETEYFAEDSNGVEHSFSLEQLLDTVPTGYGGYVIGRGFGLRVGRDIRKISIPLAGSHITLRFGRPLTPEQIQQTRDWVRTKTHQVLGVYPVRIHILKYEITTFYDEVPIRSERRLYGRDTVDLQGELR